MNNITANIDKFLQLISKNSNDLILAEGDFKLYTPKPKMKENEIYPT